MEHDQFVSTLSKGRNFTITRSTLLPFGNKVECCFDVIAGVHGALVGPSVLQIGDGRRSPVYQNKRPPVCTTYVRNRTHRAGPSAAAVTQTAAYSTVFATSLTAECEGSRSLLNLGLDIRQVGDGAPSQILASTTRIALQDLGRSYRTT